MPLAIARSLRVSASLETRGLRAAPAAPPHEVSWVQPVTRGGRKTRVRKPLTGPSTATKMCALDQLVVCDVSTSGNTAIAAPTQQAQVGHWSEQSSLHGSPGR